MKWGVLERSQNEAPNEAEIHEKVSFVDPGRHQIVREKLYCWRCGAVLHIV